MGGEINDIVGMTCGRLTVISDSGKRSKSGNVIWECMCECGGTILLTRKDLDGRFIKSCGCVHRNTKDVLGERVGSLTYTKIHGRKPSGDIIWECLCDCGNKVYGTRARIVTLREKSCGCTVDWELKVAKIIHGSIRSKCASKNIPMGLSVEDVASLSFSDCYYCGVAPSNSMAVNHAGEQVNIKYSGIDRVICDIGYVLGNVVASCRRCNIAKNDMDLNDFLLMCERVSSRAESIRNAYG